MRNYADYFRGKRITLMGLGLLGRGTNVAKFVASCGAADVLITDLKTRAELAASVTFLEGFPNVRFALGGHRMRDFDERDLVIKAAGVPLDSPYIARAEKNGIPVKMDASLFAELAPPGVIMVGVTGTRGKSTTTHLIYHIVRAWRTTRLMRRGIPRLPRVFLGGNVRNTATLPFLKTVRPGDYVILELDSWQLQGFGTAEISPHVAVFTSFFDDHLNYYRGNRERYLADKANIFLRQKIVSTTDTHGARDARVPRHDHDVFVLGAQATGVMKTYYPRYIRRAHVIDGAYLPKSWRLTVPGEHNRYNASLALAAADALGISRPVSRRAVEGFRGLPGRLEYLGVVRGARVYNDNNATTPEATIAALRALGDVKKKNIILIMGGSDKGLDMSQLVDEVKKFCKTLVLIPGSGTEVLMATYNPPPIILHGRSLKTALSHAFEKSVKGDTILFSPSFASFGLFKNEYDRNDQFTALVRASSRRKKRGEST